MKRKWTPEESAQALRRYPNEPTPDIAEDLGRTPSSVYQHARNHGVYKSEDHKRRIQQESARKLHESGKAYRFKPGHETWNKGTHYDNGGYATQFKKGNRPHHTRPLGSERVDRDGIRWRKVAEPGEWTPVHVLLWEEHNGPLPDGCFVVFANRDQTDIQIDNLVCVDRAENMRRNTIHRYPAELVSAIRQLDWFDRKLGEHAHE